jgi:hypothetical protein
MPARAVFTTVPFTLQQVQLGSLVSNVRQPHQDALHCPRPLERNRDWFERDQVNYEGHLHTRFVSRFRACLTQLFAVWRSHTRTDGLQLSAIKGNVYELSAPETLFEGLCGVKAVRAYLERNIEKGRDTYFIIDATALKEDQDSSHMGGQAHIPVAALTGAPIPPPLDQAADLEMSTEQEKETAKEEAWTTPGERIFAICYRRVGYKWYESSNVDKGVLESTNRWRIVTDNKGAGDDDDDDDEDVEADLTSSDELDGAIAETLTSNDGIEWIILDTE